jgi:hypothetical protein
VALSLKTSRRFLSEILLFFLILVLMLPTVSCTQAEEVSFRDEVEKLYVLIKDLPSDKVSDIVDGLNVLLVDVDANADRATNAQWASWSEKVHVYLGEAERLRQSESAEGRFQLVMVVVQLLVVTGLSYLVWSVFPKVFWAQWLRYKGNWSVKYED